MKIIIFALTLVFSSPAFSHKQKNDNSLDPAVSGNIIPFPKNTKNREGGPSPLSPSHNNIIPLTTQDIEVLLQIGLKDMENNNYIMAMNTFSYILDIHPAYYMAYYHRGLAVYQLYKLEGMEDPADSEILDSAIRDLQTTLLFNDISNALYFLAVLYDEKQDHKMSNDYYNQLLKKIKINGKTAYPDVIPKSQFYLLAGKVKSKTGNYKQALKYFNRSIQLDPSRLPTYMVKANTLLVNGAKQAAIFVYNKYIQYIQNHIKEKNSEIFRQSPMARKRKKRHEIIIDDGFYTYSVENRGRLLSRELSVPESLSWVHLHRGIVYDSMDQATKALSNFEQAVLYNPLNLKAVLFYSMSLLKNNQLEKSLEQLNKGLFLQEMPGQPYALFLSTGEINILPEEQVNTMLFGFSYIFLSVRASVKEALQDYSGALEDLNTMKTSIEQIVNNEYNDFPVVIDEGKIDASQTLLGKGIEHIVSQEQASTKKRIIRIRRRLSSKKAVHASSQIKMRNTQKQRTDQQNLCQQQFKK